MGLRIPFLLGAFPPLLSKARLSLLMLCEKMHSAHAQETCLVPEQKRTNPPL